MNEYTAYVVVIRKNGEWLPVMREFTEFTCYSINSHMATIFKTIRQANVLKKEIMHWKGLKLYGNGYDIFSNVSIAEIKLKPFKPKFVKVIKE